jgi:rhodanese-related sulfurtransferase
MEFKTISREDLPGLLENPKATILDIRETWEFVDFNIGGINIPPHEIPDRTDEIADYEQIILACSNGFRSGIVARMLTKKLPNAEILHLEEGIF